MSFRSLYTGCKHFQLQKIIFSISTCNLFNLLLQNWIKFILSSSAQLSDPFFFFLWLSINPEYQTRCLEGEFCVFDTYLTGLVTFLCPSPFAIALLSINDSSRARNTAVA